MVGYFSKTIKHCGGVVGYVKALYIRDSAKHGRLVGTDKYGNRYYENNDYFFLRNRWVEYADHVGLNYDGSQIPAEWFGWMHHRTDLTPDQEPFRPKYHWILPHEENMSGTPLEYVPCTTVNPKILAWVPPKPCPPCPPLDGDGCGERRALSECGEETKGCGEKTPPVCGEITPPVCGERTPPVCGETTSPRWEEKTCEEKTSPRCEGEEVKNDCGERPEEEKRPPCEKPSRAFH